MQLSRGIPLNGDSIIYNANIDHREIDRLLSKRVLSPDSKRNLLLSKGSTSATET